MKNIHPNILHNFSESVVCITGASKGIGKSICMEFAKSGATVIIGSRDVKKSNEIVKKCEGLKGKVISRKLNLTKSKSIMEFFDFVNTRFKGIDIFVNNAGVTNVKPAIDISEAEFDEISNTNFRGLYFCCCFTAKNMIENKKKGVIINISSQVSHVGGPLRAVYSGSKGAVNSITRSLAAEWAKYGIRVVGVSPTFTKTEMMIKNKNNNEFKKNFKKIPMGRPAEPIEIASTVLFLASSAASFITGDVIRVDGGFTII